MPARSASAPRLLPFLPLPVVGARRASATAGWPRRTCRSRSGGCRRSWATPGCCCAPTSTCACSGARACSRVGEYATLNANYLLARLKQAGFDAAYPQRRASHEFILTLKRQARELDVTAMDFAKRLLDHGFHAPTTYFPLLVPECLLIEPTETESKETLDAFVAAMSQIQKEAEQEPERVTQRSAYHAGAPPGRRAGGQSSWISTWKPTAQP